jgi:4-hydroxybenzoate polyprenyltransferase
MLAASDLLPAITESDWNPIADLPGAANGSQTWIDIFSIVAYVLLIGCIFGGARRAYKTKAGPWGVVGQVVIIALFVGLFFALESLAHARTPYYVYAPQFRDKLPRLPVENWIGQTQNPLFRLGLPNQCTAVVRHLQTLPGTSKIPLSVVIFEASLAYSAMWTARLLGAARWTQPLLAGLVLITVDALLDPVVAISHICDRNAYNTIFPGAQGAKLGFWHWYVPRPEDLITPGQRGPDGQNLLETWWFHIPIFNFAAWLGAPIVLTLLVSLLSQLPSVFERSGSRAERKRLLGECGLLLALALAIGAILMVAPNSNPRPWVQTLVFCAALAVAITAFFFGFGRFKVTSRTDVTLVAPVALGLALPFVAAVTSGQVITMPALMLVTAFFFGWGFWLIFLPYRPALERFAEVIGDIDRYCRIHYFGFTAMLVLLGGALAEPSPTVRTNGALLLIAIGFHVFAYVLNDVIDLPIDRTVDRRKGDPLVRGAVSPETSVGVAVSAVPVALLGLLFLLRFDLSAPSSIGALAALLSSFALMLVYNRYGKRCPWPLVTDVAEGLSWALLSLAAMLATSVHSSDPPSGFAVGSWSLAAYGALYILLINGIHGGLRDLETDVGAKMHTMASWLGARAIPQGSGKPAIVQSTGRVAAFAYLVHTLLFGDVVFFVLRNWNAGFSSSSVAVFVLVTLGAMCIVSGWMLHLVVKMDEPRRDFWISMHLFVLLLPVIFVFVMAKDPCPAFKWAVGCTFFGPLLLQKDVIDGLIEIAYRRQRREGAGPVRGRKARKTRLATSDSSHEPDLTPTPSGPTTASAE